jgi:hypothetical protein
LTFGPPVGSKGASKEITDVYLGVVDVLLKGNFLKFEAISGPTVLEPRPTILIVLQKEEAITKDKSMITAKKETDSSSEVVFLVLRGAKGHCLQFKIGKGVEL